MRPGAAIALAMVIVLSGPAAHASSGSDLKDKQEELARVRRQRAAAAAKLDAERATSTQLRDALSAMQADLDAQQSYLRRAERTSDTAEKTAATARAIAEMKRTELDAARQRTRDTALAAYVQPMGSSAFEVLASGSGGEVALRVGLARLQASQLTEATDDLRAASQDLEAAVREADRLAAAADERRRDASTYLVTLQSAEDRQTTLADQAEARLEDALGEADALATLDATLAASIRQDQQDLAAELQRTQLAAAKRAPRPATSATSATPAASGSTPSNAGRPTATNAPRPPTTSTARPAAGAARPAPSATTPVPAAASPATTPSPVGGTSPGDPAPPPSGSSRSPSRDIVTVFGIEVDASIAGSLTNMINAAAQAGLTLRGGGFRSPDEQIAVRRNNCGPSDYDIWQKPASQCRPPAARPGSSMHEQGLAIDVTCNGALISSRSNRCFGWLAANASSYGFFNQPSEAWHWSTNGR